MWQGVEDAIVFLGINEESRVEPKNVIIVILITIMCCICSFNVGEVVGGKEMCKRISLIAPISCNN